MSKCKDGAAPGIEPGTSCTRSKNHTTRPRGHNQCARLRVIHNPLPLLSPRSRPERSSPPSHHLSLRRRVLPASRSPTPTHIDSHHTHPQQQQQLTLLARLCSTTLLRRIAAVVQKAKIIPALPYHSPLPSPPLVTSLQYRARWLFGSSPAVATGYVLSTTSAGTVGEQFSVFSWRSIQSTLPTRGHGHS